MGPGYNDLGVPKQGLGTVKPREGGEFNERNFEAAIASGTPLLAKETWNESHEASGIAETQEYGRKYLEMTRRLAARFHSAGE